MEVKNELVDVVIFMNGFGEVVIWVKLVVVRLWWIVEDYVMDMCILVCIVSLKEWDLLLKFFME